MSEDKELKQWKEKLFYQPKNGYDQINAEQTRSEERRVGKECRSRWSPYH